MRGAFLTSRFVIGAVVYIALSWVLPFMALVMAENVRDTVLIVTLAWTLACAPASALFWIALWVESSFGGRSVVASFAALFVAPVLNVFVWRFAWLWWKGRKEAVMPGHDAVPPDKDAL